MKFLKNFVTILIYFLIKSLPVASYIFHVFRFFFTEFHLADCKKHVAQPILSIVHIFNIHPHFFTTPKITYANFIYPKQVKNVLKFSVSFPYINI